MMRNLSLLFLWLVCCFALKPCKDLVQNDFVIKGIINVIYLMNYTCDFCYNEAELLPSLQLNMMSRGIIINTVIAINSNPENITNQVPDVSIDTGKLWSALGQHNSDIFIIDKCNRLAYNVIMPWSQNKYPFVKAAILSTYHSEPCGLCSISSVLHEKNTNNRIGTTLIQYPAIKRQISLDDILISEDNETLPMRIIVQQKHQHEGDSKIYDQIELLADDPSYHQHPEDEDKYFFDTKYHHYITTTTTTNKDTIDNEKEKLDIQNSYNSYKIQNEFDKIQISAQNISDEITDKQALSSHYFNILHWLPQV